MTKRLEVQAIIKNSELVKQAGLDWKHVYANIYEGTEANTLRTFRHDNTLVTVEIKAPGVGVVNIFSSDAPAKVMADFIQCLTALRVAGYTTLYVCTSRIMQLNALRRAGISVDVAPGPTDKAGKATWVGTIHV
jgi:hypothetical protein